MEEDSMLLRGFPRAGSWEACPFTCNTKSLFVKLGIDIQLMLKCTAQFLLAIQLTELCSAISLAELLIRNCNLITVISYPVPPFLGDLSSTLLSGQLH